LHILVCDANYACRRSSTSGSVVHIMNVTVAAPMDLWCILWM